MKFNCRQCGVEVLIHEDGLCAECVSLRDNPDPLSKRKTLHGKEFKDLKQLDEADRFKLIAKNLELHPGANIALMVETSAPYKGKGDRYIAGVKALLPAVTVVSRKPGPVIETETIIFRL